MEKGKMGDWRREGGRVGGREGRREGGKEGGTYEGDEDVKLGHKAGGCFDEGKVGACSLDGFFD